MNEDAIVYHPVKKHYCDVDGLPYAADYPAGTIGKCLVCGGYCFVDYADHAYWMPVRWYHLRKRRIIRALEAEDA